MNKKIVTVIISSVLFLTIGWYVSFQSEFIKNILPEPPIKVGILHSLTGTMAISEKPVVDSTLMAIEEINLQGGILGRIIEPVVVDGRSDWPTFAEEAERLIVEEKVSVVFGCWTSASRKTVKPIFEEYNHLLFYPVQYEGLEHSKNIIYTGAAPNQQIIPAIKWCFDNLGHRFFLVGSDYVFPRTANEIIKDILTVLKGEVLGEEYISLGSDDVDDVVLKIRETQPDVILNTINGDSNIHFFKRLGEAGITSEKVPTMSFSIAEDELRVMGAEHMVGNYASWNYFQSLDSNENREFVEKFKKKYGSHRVTDDPMEAGYFGVKLWAQAVREAGTDDVDKVRKAVKNQSYGAPGGMVYVDSENNHVWKTVRIGVIREDGQFNIVWSSEKPVRPVPYPAYRSKSQWNGFLQYLYESWGGNWANSE
ncbi:MAG: urea ABC transporter substrate-binding protein [Candidatus Scalindua sp.]|nr:urea ABC transporter substrate-binding protein [Candidatus Scalindua sp.]